VLFAVPVHIMVVVGVEAVLIIVVVVQMVMTKVIRYMATRGGGRGSGDNGKKMSLMIYELFVKLKLTDVHWVGQLIYDPKYKHAHAHLHIHTYLHTHTHTHIHPTAKDTCSDKPRSSSTSLFRAMFASR
jgi:hypothetical protein